MRTSTRACVVRLGGLTTEVAAAYDDLRFDRRQPWLRLEQEREWFAPMACSEGNRPTGR